jgi:hypothetical protein
MRALLLGVATLALLCGPGIGATTTRVTFGIARNAARVFRPWSLFLTIPIVSRCAAIILGLRNSSGILAMFTAILRASSLLSNLAADRRPRSHFPARPTIEFRSYIKPELGELQVHLAQFVHIGVARPFETFFGHDAVLRSRFHRIAPIPIRGFWQLSCWPVQIQRLPFCWFQRANGTAR